MMEQHKPIHRDSAIISFSKDHHYALLLVWKIRQGLTHTISPKRIATYVIHFFNNNLIHHFKEEETLLFSKLPESNLLRKQAENDHKNIIEIVMILKQHTDNNLLGKFADLLEKHIRFEERELFNFLQQNLKEEKLAEIAALVKIKAHGADEAWSDQFWEIKN